MSEQSVSRPVRSRSIEVADHIWEAFEQMAVEMGAERDGLVNQAMFMFARLNGFLQVGAPAVAELAAPRLVEEPRVEEPLDEEPLEDLVPPPAVRVVTPSPRPAPLPKPEPEQEFNFEDKTPLPVAAPLPPPPPAAPPRRSPGPGPRAPRAEEPAPPPRRAADSNGESRRRMTESALPSQESAFEMAPPGSMDNDPDRKLVAERVLETAAELERLIKGKQQLAEAPPQPEQDIDQDIDEEVEPDPVLDDGIEEAVSDFDAEPDAGPSLVMLTGDGEERVIEQDRFVIGRGKHCDLVINSGKVSREHAAITRDGDEFFIEDLGSSNGTWFNKQRIKRRKIDDGDEFFVCSDKIRFTVR